MKTVPRWKSLFSIVLQSAFVLPSPGAWRSEAMGFFLEDKQCAQVSMNLLDFHVTSLRTVFDAVAARARDAGVEVLESELIGLAPAAAIDAGLAKHIKLPNFDPSQQVVEQKLSN